MDINIYQYFNQGKKHKDINDHSYRVSLLTEQLCKIINLDDQTCIRLKKMALVHDIGKFFIPEEILYKTSKLTTGEFDVIKSHTTEGFELMKKILNEDLDLLDAIRHHHENYDGTGYPDELKGDEISLPCRIISICDVYEALRSERAYKPKLSHTEVLLKMNSIMSNKFQPELLECFSRINHLILDSIVSIDSSNNIFEI